MPRTPLLAAATASLSFFGPRMLLGPLVAGLAGAWAAPAAAQAQGQQPGQPGQAGGLARPDGPAGLGEPVETLAIEKGGLSVLLRDNASSPRVLSGIDSLVHLADAPGFDAFDPDEPGASAGLNFEHVISGHPSPFNSFTPRRGPCSLHAMPGGASAVLVRRAEDDPWALASTFKYTVAAPNAVDFELRCRARDPRRFGERGYAVLFFADYMNDVAAPAIRFRGIAGPRAEEGWIESDAPPGHTDYSGGGTFRSAGAPALEYDADHNFKLNLWSYEYPRFTRPFYYGLAAKGMVLLLMFDRAWTEEDEVRFSLFKFKLPRRPRPAWDFQYVIHKVEADREYGFKGRLVWKRFVSAEDCLDEYERWRAAQDDVRGLRLPGLSRPVDVHFDRHGIPHVFADAWTDAARALGYLHAGDRLWQMDIFRRRGSGTLAEVLGKEHLASDVLVRQLGLRRSCERLWESAELPEDLREELLAYSGGVNARLAELGEAGLPAPFRRLGYRPAPWSPADSLVFSKYMAWDQSGTDTDLWLGRMAEKLGPAALEELWPLERPYEVPAVKAQAQRPKSARAPLRPAPGAPGAGATAARAPWPVHGADAAAAPRLRPVPGAAAAIAAAERHLAAARPPGRAASAGHSGICGSNNWAVSGARTASGKPILASDPHLGFQLPSIWYAWHAAVKGRAVAGAGFPVSPVVIIGHNDRAGWGLTNMQADAVDYFVETLRPGDPLVAGDPPRYLHRGEWKPVERSSEEIAVRGEAPRAVQVDATVHGPIVAREGEGRAVALAWTGLGPTREVVALWKMNRASGLGELLEALDELAVPAMNVACADLDGNIALHPCGALPLRTPGQGRIPMDGASGEGDWAGMIPRTELPLAVNPPEGFVASANGRPAPLGYPHYLGWMWDPSYRARRIQEMLSRASGLTVASMAAIQLDVHDEAAERFLPPLLAALDPRSLEDDAARRATAALRDWDYAARGDSPAPALWLEWLRRYRDLVWGDEWRARGIETEPGSWGYTSDNRREPVLEVLEYMTREHPRSAWFDDRATPAREGRDEIAARAFIAAVSSLRRRLGDDMSLWAWTRRNVLRIPSLTGDAPLERVGGPVPGSAFTVNPGGDGDGVGGGASWRMIVDFGDPTASAGAYPGGQSEDPASPHYDDLIPLWAAGRYVQLHCVTAPERLPPEARSKTLRLVP